MVVVSIPVSDSPEESDIGWYRLCEGDDGGDDAGGDNDEVDLSKIRISLLILVSSARSFDSRQSQFRRRDSRRNGLLPYLLWIQLDPTHHTLVFSFLTLFV